MGIVKEFPAPGNFYPAYRRPRSSVLGLASADRILGANRSPLGELKVGRRRWLRSGVIEVQVSHAIRFAPEQTGAAITARLHAEVTRLLEGSS